MVLYSLPFGDPVLSNVSFSNVSRKLQTTKLGINKGGGSAWQTKKCFSHNTKQQHLKLITITSLSTSTSVMSKERLPRLVVVVGGVEMKMAHNTEQMGSDV